MRTREERYDLVVCGGGLAGFCAAVAAARHGAKTCLVQDRPVLGGNSSSEIRVSPQGAANFHAYARETGIISELLIEERASNHEHQWTNSVWDLILYDMAMRTDGLTVHLNTSIASVDVAEGRTIRSVTGRVAASETELTLHADLFIDCTGDGIVAELAGCEWRMGSEGRDEFMEPHAPALPSADVMGSSIYFRAVDTGRPAPFKRPEWAHSYEDASFFYEKGRIPEPGGGYWWLELGVPWHTIYDGETIRHELTRHLLGVWDFVKNKDPRLKLKAANYAIDWIGQVPGKRESRRIMGEYIVTEHDLTNVTAFADEVVFGGWFIDLHSPGGLLADVSEPTAVAGHEHSVHMNKSFVGPFGLPLRAFMARDASNLLMAGRNISVTHVALGSVRVMGTTALMGQAVGTAAAVSLKRGEPVKRLTAEAIAEVQQTLLRDGCFLPGRRNEDPSDLARSASVSASSEAVMSAMLPADAGETHDGASGRDVLRERRGQWIAVDGGELEKLSVCVSNLSDREQTLQVCLTPVEHIWEYRVRPQNPAAEACLTVPPGERQWIEWPVRLPAGWMAEGYARLDAAANPNLVWHRAKRPEPGLVSATERGGGRMRRFEEGVAMSLRIEPGQRCYRAEQVISGVTRPHRSTNLWRSDPEAGLPGWVELRWPEPATLQIIELTFPGHLLRDFRFYPAAYKAPECPRDYAVWAWQDGVWRELLQVEGNYQRHRRHKLAAKVRTDRLKIVITATNGSPSAELYEIRCYES
ncbi:FAD-dependent oxidoreductase [Paenibacillus ginsengarvi]|uniref:FAD-dependent oxidoreductase n=1 Tax=Paenibacillus ginsengarvi TaxID=400777 RepID=A0A3B0CMG3_9BACL|nr:FAD-dependent oxidoreductase [Paenibacillus ginsengarvi]RKN85577.1 FAD-dependent oxidoreductase [Paenibacillus ginsengarvi]